MNIDVLVGLTLSDINAVGKEHIEFETQCGRKFVMTHYQDCCETVEIADISGELEDIVGSPILSAYESTCDGSYDVTDTSGTWTFYNIATIKGSVCIRWLGESNGYYGESVDFEEKTL